MRKWLKKHHITASLSLRGWLIFLAVMAAAAAFCALLRGISTSDVHVPMIFVLAVLVISLSTEGYLYGILASFVSVIMVNYAFTYPYNKLDFSIYGYPLTFLTMLAVGFVASTLASRVKEQERVRIESEKEKVRANLLRAVSHDLRTPLTSISGALETLINDDGTITENERQALMRDALSDSEWLCRMVENLLSVTRIEDGGDSHLNKQQELLEEVISEAVGSFKKRGHQIDISVDLPEEPLFVPMDALLIEQVLLNLLNNTAEHGECATDISITASERSGMVVIEVSDNGQGIEKAILDRLNRGEPIRTGLSDRGDKKRGMGIGLTVCRSIMEAHGGQFFAENSAAGGARFVLSLPLEGE